MRARTADGTLRVALPELEAALATATRVRLVRRRAGEDHREVDGAQAAICWLTGITATAPVTGLSRRLDELLAESIEADMAADGMGPADVEYARGARSILWWAQGAQPLPWWIRSA